MWRPAARRCIAPGGRVVLSVIGRVCPWEMAWYLAHGNARRAFLRRSRGAVAVPLNGRTVWTRYYTPRELYRAFAPDFDLVSYRALRLFAPPPYLEGVRRRLPWLSNAGVWLDDCLGGQPVSAMPAITS